MKAILEFNLPEDSNEFKLSQKGSEYYCALWDIAGYIRSKTKYSELTENEERMLEEIRDLIPSLEDIE